MKHAEDDCQKAQVKYLTDRRRYKRDVMFCAVPNGGRRGKIEAARLIGLGVVPGAPDMIVWMRGRCICIENKVRPNTPTASQEAFGAGLTALGFEYHVIAATDPADAVDRLHRILGAA